MELLWLARGVSKKRVKKTIAVRFLLTDVFEIARR
jgi:hypothetical protein